MGATSLLVGADRVHRHQRCRCEHVHEGLAVLCQAAVLAGQAMDSSYEGNVVVSERAVVERRRARRAAAFRRPDVDGKAGGLCQRIVLAQHDEDQVPPLSACEVIEGGRVPVRNDVGARGDGPLHRGARPSEVVDLSPHVHSASALRSSGRVVWRVEERGGRRTE